MSYRKKWFACYSCIHDGHISTFEWRLRHALPRVYSPVFLQLAFQPIPVRKLCEFVTRYSFASIHLKNDAGTYFKKTFSQFRGYRTGELLHQEGIYGHLCNFFILNVGDVFFLHRRRLTRHIQQKLDILQVQGAVVWALPPPTQDTFLRGTPVRLWHLPIENCQRRDGWDHTWTYHKITLRGS